MTPQDTCLEALERERSILLDDPLFGVDPEALKFCKEIEAAIKWVKEQKS